MTTLLNLFLGFYHCRLRCFFGLLSSRIYKMCSNTHQWTLLIVVDYEKQKLHRILFLSEGCCSDSKTLIFRMVAAWDINSSEPREDVKQSLETSTDKLMHGFNKNKPTSTALVQRSVSKKTPRKLLVQNLKSSILLISVHVITTTHHQ